MVVEVVGTFPFGSPVVVVIIGAGAEEILPEAVEDLEAIEEIEVVGGDVAVVTPGEIFEEEAVEVVEEVLPESKAPGSLRMLQTVWNDASGIAC